MYPPNYPNKDNLNEINLNLIDLIHKSKEQPYVNNTNHQISPEIINLIKQKKKIRRQLKSAKDDTSYRLRREINFLQREIRRAFKGSNERQNRKLIETAKQAGNKGFCKAIKTITNDKQQSSGSHLQITFKNKIAVTDIEKYETFKSLLSETMKEHQYENENLQSNFLETEQNTKLLLEANPNEITEDIFLSIEEFKNILKQSSKSCPGPDKISYQILKQLPKTLKHPYAYLFPAQLTVLNCHAFGKIHKSQGFQNLNNTGRKQKITDQIFLSIALPKSVKLLLKKSS